MKYDTQQINELERIEDYIGKFIDLKRTGKNLKGCCPFHNSASGESFVVFPETQSWHCYGACHESGDRIKFHMKKFNLEFKDACKDLSNGHTLSEDYKPKPTPKRPKINESFYPAKEDYDNAENATGNAYTELKKIPVEILQELKAKQVDDKILIPMFGGGKIKGFQDIQSSRDWGAEKITRGNTGSAILGKLKNGVPILLGEGIATCASAYIATEKNLPVVIAFNSGRLALVAKVLRKRYADSEIYILTDLDKSMTGQNMSIDISENVDNVYPIMPSNNLHGMKSFDFSDLHLKYGLDTVGEVINNTITKPPCGSGQCKPDGISKVMVGGKLQCLNCDKSYKEIPYGVNILNRRYEE